MALPAPDMATATSIDDATLIAQVREGDERAFSLLYKRHARHVAGVVYRLLGDDGQLDDIVQETFVIGLRQLDSLREPAALRRWLTTIAVRRVKRHLADRYRSREIAGELKATVPTSIDPTARAEVQALYRSLARLPDKLRLPWMLHHIEGETLPVVAELCESSLTSVKRHIAAANQRLRRLGHA
ncbi:MAG: sigma-70 family RNA polymerase sigma factor [Polyangiaceae bacterium]